jgi:hypothetical protein
VVAGGCGRSPRRLPRSRVQGVTADVGWSSTPYDAVLALEIERGEPSDLARGPLVDVNAVGPADPFRDVARPMTAVAQPAAGHNSR